MKYDWTQTDRTLVINFTEITEKPNIKYDGNVLIINDENKMLIDEVKDFNWYICDYLVVEFNKTMPKMWDSLFVDEEVQPENVYNQEMDDESKVMLEKMIYEQKQKQKNEVEEVNPNFENTEQRNSAEEKE